MQSHFRNGQRKSLHFISNLNEDRLFNVKPYTAPKQHIFGCAIWHNFERRKYTKINANPSAREKKMGFMDILKLRHAPEMGQTGSRQVKATIKT